MQILVKNKYTLLYDEFEFKCSVGKRGITSKKIANIIANIKINDKLKVKKFQDLLGYQTKNIIFKNIHGWGFAYSKFDTKLDSIWFNNNKLGICADWFKGSKAEGSWLSAKSLYKKIKKTRLS